MANRPFEYTIINPLERPTSSDLNKMQGQAHYDVRQFAYEIFGHQDGFLGGSFAPSQNTPPNDRVVLSAGVAFQQKAGESNIGGILGLNDTYGNKAVNIDDRLIAVTAAPLSSGQKRYDLIQIRAPFETERLTDSTATDIYNPALNSFSAPIKSKTLTSSLTGFSPEYIAVGNTPTSPLSYVTGNAGVYASWSSVPKPAVSSGYMAVAYIRREYGQTSITTGDIEDARTLLKLPADVGGTGSDSVSIIGSVAYSDGTKLAYTQATTGFPSYLPATGHLLASDATGAPNWIAPAVASSLLVSAGANTNPTWLTPGTVGQVIVSNGTSWEAGELYKQYASFQTTLYSTDSGTYSEITQLSRENMYFNPGVVRVRIQPRETTNDNLAPSLYLSNIGSVNSATGYLKFVITGGAVTQTYIFKGVVGPDDVEYLPLPAFACGLPAGTYTIRVYARITNDGILYAENCLINISQG